MNLFHWLSRQLLGAKQGDALDAKAEPIIAVIAPLTVGTELGTVLGALNLPADAAGFTSLYSSAVDQLHLSDAQKAVVKAAGAPLILNGGAAQDLPNYLLAALKPGLKALFAASLDLIPPATALADREASFAAAIETTVAHQLGHIPFLAVPIEAALKGEIAAFQAALTATSLSDVKQAALNAFDTWVDGIKI